MQLILQIVLFLWCKQYESGDFDILSLVSLFSPLSELINMAVPDTIDNRAINKTKNGKISLFKKHENLTLAINSAKVTWLELFLNYKRETLNMLWKLLECLF